MVLSNNLRLLMDMDDVIVNLADELTLAYNTLFDDSLTSEQLFLDWDIHKRAKCGEEIYKIFQNPNFFYSLKPKDGAITGMQTLRHFFDINIVTSISRSPEAAKDKVKWVRDYLPFYNIHDMFMAKRKELIEGDVMVDDYAENLDKWQYAHPGGITILFASYHNVSRRNDFQHCVNNWDELIEVLGNIYKGIV